MKKRVKSAVYHMGAKCCAWGKAALKCGGKEHICRAPPGELADASKLLHRLGRRKVGASSRSPGLGHCLSQRQGTLRNSVCAGGMPLGLGEGKRASSCRPPAGAREAAEAPIRRPGDGAGLGLC